jgi:nicotinic acid phosphoribosyltransferase
MSSKQTYFRVCHKDTLQGLWYAFNGEFTGLIHNQFSFCANTNLAMDFDEEIVGWLSAVETLENLFFWFTEKDIKALQKHGWFIHEFEAEDVKFYERFQHTVIKQDTSKVVKVHELMLNGQTRE